MLGHLPTLLGPLTGVEFQKDISTLGSVVQVAGFIGVLHTSILCTSNNDITLSRTNNSI
jgi:hypothetical protein